MRINKFIASRSEYSRRKVDELIKEKKVSVNNRIIPKPGIIIDPEKDIVKVDNVIIKNDIPKIYLALNKPAEYISTRSDEKDRKTIMELLPKVANLKPVGRLDKDTEGLILISNDGEFINKITHPRFECEKEYFVRIKSDINSQNIKKLEKGIILEGKKTSPAKIKIIKAHPDETVLTITIHEGRKRQIRKMFASVNHPVKYLKRIRIDKIKLNSLQKGKYRNLTKAELHVYKLT